MTDWLVQVRDAWPPQAWATLLVGLGAAVVAGMAWWQKRESDRRAELWRRVTWCFEHIFSEGKDEQTLGFNVLALYTKGDEKAKDQTGDEKAKDQTGDEKAKDQTGDEKAKDQTGGGQAGDGSAKKGNKRDESLVTKYDKGLAAVLELFAEQRQLQAEGSVEKVAEKYLYGDHVDETIEASDEGGQCDDSTEEKPATG